MQKHPIINRLSPRSQEDSRLQSRFPELFRHSTVLLSLALALVVLMVYWPVQYHDFAALDDDQYVAHNPIVRAGLTSQGLLWAFTFGNEFYWHPLTWLSHMLDCQLYGANPQGHHLNNVLLHMFNTLLLFLSLKRLTGALWRSAAVALLFAVHPLNVESVAWVAGRKNLLGAFFGILTISAYIRYCERPGARWYAALLVAFSLSLMSKPLFITLPLVLLVLDYWPLRRIDGRFKRVTLEKAPLAFLSFLSFGASIASGRINDILVSPDALPMLLRIENGLVSFVSYIWKTLWPSHLTFFYPYPDSIPLWKSSACGLMLVAATLVVWRLARRLPFLFTGWAWYIITLLPVIGIVQQGLWPERADRFAYIPLVGLFIQMVWGSAAAAARSKRLQTALFTIWIVSSAALVWSCSKQIKHWGDAETLWNRAIQFSEQGRTGLFPLFYNLAFIKAGKGDLQEASLLYARALGIYPDHPSAHNNLGNILARQGKNREAVEHLLAAVRVNPGFAAAHNNLGNIFMQEGRLEKAIEHFSMALRLNPHFSEARYNIERALTQKEPPK
jgi:hypothetical protein